MESFNLCLPVNMKIHNMILQNAITLMPSVFK